MAAKERTYVAILGVWQRLLAQLTANIAELAHLGPHRAKLEGILARAVDINQQQTALTASKQEMSKQLQELVIEGQRLTTVLRLSIKEHYGIRAEKLAEFNLQPFRGRSRSAKPAPEPETPSPTAPPAGKSNP